MSLHPFPNEATPLRILHTMLRVAELDRSLKFYVTSLGMKLFRREEYPEGRFTLAFVGYGDEESAATIELTHNWDRFGYDLGSAYGHIALAVTNVQSTCAMLAAGGVRILRPPGRMKFSSPSRRAAEVIAFIEDPDGYRIELIEPGA